MSDIIKQQEIIKQATVQITTDGYGQYNVPDGVYTGKKIIGVNSKDYSYAVFRTYDSGGGRAFKVTGSTPELARNVTFNVAVYYV